MKKFESVPRFETTTSYLCNVKLKNVNVMVAKKMNMDKLIDLGMTKLFQLAEFVCSRCSLYKCEPATPQSKPVVPTIRFSDADRMVEGELFK